MALTMPAINYTHNTMQCCPSPNETPLDDLRMWELSIQNALEVARESENDMDPHVLHYLESEADYLWQRLQREPDAYVMLKDEFALFNFFIYRYQGSKVAEKAVARFWQSYTGSSPLDA